MTHKTHVFYKRCKNCNKPRVGPAESEGCVDLYGFIHYKHIWK